MPTFSNSGLIDLNCIRTFGVSVKESSNPIGYFGTGLKYALAILLRHKCEVTLHRGFETYHFSLKPIDVRGAQVNVVTMNDEQLGFTDQLGKNWELWQAIRELYCNTLDESGEVDLDETAVPEEDKTIFVVRGPGINQIIQNRYSPTKGFLLATHQSVPILDDESVQIYLEPSKFIYYRGVRVAETHYPMLYTYNILHDLDLTEDRTTKFNYQPQMLVCRALARCESTHSGYIQVLENILLAPEKAWESGFDFYGWAFHPGETFTEVVKRNTLKFSRTLNRTAQKLCALSIADALPKIAQQNLSPTDQLRHDKALRFLSRIGFVVDCPIIYTEFLGQEILGRASGETIYISRATLLQGTKRLAGTILEEYLHIKYSLVDYTIGMQNFLIDTIISVGELVTNEVL